MVDWGSLYGHSTQFHLMSSCSTFWEVEGARQGLSLIGAAHCLVQALKAISGQTTAAVRERPLLGEGPILDMCTQGEV